MKSKNVILGSVAFVFAIGTAVASMYAITPARLKVRLPSQASVTCQTTGVSCESTGTIDCIVNIQYQPTEGGTTTTVPLVAYSNAACTIALKQTSGSLPQAATFGVVRQYNP